MAQHPAFPRRCDTAEPSGGRNSRDRSARRTGQLAWISITVAALACIAMLPLAGAAEAPSDPASKSTATAKTATNKKLHHAAEELKTEALEVGRYAKEIDVIPHFSRPHPALASFGREAVHDVLERMLRPFTGNAYEDTYVRWHMMHVVKEANDEDRRKIGPQLVKLIRQMPGPLDIPARRWWRWVPEENGSAWHHLYNTLRVVTGYPPYEKRHDPPASFDYMDAETRAWAEERWKKVQELKETFETVYDQDAIAFNGRVRKVNWMVRQYRGELIYQLFFTGDPEMARLVINAIQNHAGKNNGIALDLLSFWYLAAFDGALDLYEPQVLEGLSQQLERIAQANDTWYEYQYRQRNFADYAFHMVTMLREGSVHIEDPQS